MKTSIEHLPKQKQEELEKIVQIINESITAEMIILFGSYARGDWVEELHDDGFHYQYQSDFDILVVVNTRKNANKYRRRNKMEDDIRRLSSIQTPITFIYHNIGFFNHALREGQYFFSDIKTEGILLYNSGKCQLSESHNMSLEERQIKATKHFEKRFESANEFLKQFQNAFINEWYGNSTFQLHQATERYYAAILLAFTDYKPKTHDIKELGKQVAAQEPAFLKIFPLGTKEDERLFELLRKAYIDARYDDNFSVTKDELQWLVERVKMLKELTEKICKIKIASFVNQSKTL